jgi:hypothetical protein
MKQPPPPPPPPPEPLELVTEGLLPAVLFPLDAITPVTVFSLVSVSSFTSGVTVFVAQAYVTVSGIGAALASS